MLVKGMDFLIYIKIRAISNVKSYQLAPNTYVDLRDLSRLDI